jgi:hypothetical protein
MNNKFAGKTIVLLLSFSILFTSCLGSFGLTKKLHAWNHTVGGDKWINELVFVALAALQVYSVAVVVDAVVLNSIEFWTGSHPAATAQTQQIETENGVFNVTTDAQGHQIQKEGSDETIAFRFDAENRSWSLDAMGQSTPLVQFVDNNQATVYLADGSTMTVSADQAGVWALKLATGQALFFAAK